MLKKIKLIVKIKKYDEDNEDEDKKTIKQQYRVKTTKYL